MSDDLPDPGFFLAAPPGFRPFRPHEPVEVYTRKLPHWRQEGCTYFVTFRTADSLPKSALRELATKRADWERENPPPHTDEQLQEKHRLLSRLEEQWLDAGHGECPFRLAAPRDILRNKLNHAAKDKLVTRAWVIMPNHVHALFTPLPEQRLELGLKSIKGGSAVKVNKALGRSGTLWFDESFDRIVRNRNHLWKCLQYIGRNPSKARLRAGSHARWVCEEWEEAGWQFRAKEARA